MLVGARMLGEDGEAVRPDEGFSVVGRVLDNVGDGVLLFREDFDGFVVGFEVGEEDRFFGEEGVDFAGEVDLGVLEGE